MSKVKHNEENIEKLAQEITDSAELETIVQHFYEDQCEYYKNDREAFETDWDDVIGDEDQDIKVLGGTIRENSKG